LHRLSPIKVEAALPTRMETQSTQIDSRWSTCLRLIKNNVSQSQFDIWFEPISFSCFDDKKQELTLCVPSPFIMEHIEKNYLNLLRKVLNHVYGKGIRLRYTITTDATNHITQTVDGTVSATPAMPRLQTVTPNKSPEPLQELDSQLNVNYTFDNFVEGDSNKLPLTVGRAIVQNPHQATFNPLFIYGGSGVGKTHLVNAIGLKLKELYPNLRVLYVSAHLFQIQYTDSVLRNKVNDFIAFYQSIDVLIIDDVQEFTAVQKTQNAFFHIFNHLHQNGRRLILTSDRPPVALEGMEERLLTRFKWGLLAELEQPSEKLRRDILLYKIRRDGLRVAAPVVDYIAKVVDRSIRDLEGVLTSLMAYSVVNNCEIDIPLAERVISRTVGLSKRKEPISVDAILDQTCRFFAIDRDDVLSSCRKAPVVLARQVVMYLAQKHTHLSTTKIGAFVGHRGHATVIHSCQTVNLRLQNDQMFRERLAELEAQLQSR